MPISSYLAELRAIVGHRLLMMPSASAVIRDDAARILLAEDISTGFWALPGGAIEPHERPAEAVVRELHEELNVAVKPTHLLGVFGGPEYVLEYHNGDRVAYVVTLFECEIVQGAPRADQKEVAQCRFVDLADLDALPVAPWARHALRRIGVGLEMAD